MFFFHMSLCIIDAATPEALKHSINDTAIVRWKGWDTGKSGHLFSVVLNHQVVTGFDYSFIGL